MLATHRAHGTTTMMASLVTDTTERLEASVRALAPLVRSGELAGIHLEGPWLSGAHCGAHDPALLRAPDPAEVTRLLDAGEGTVRMVTLAPELDGGLEAVAAARRTAASSPPSGTATRRTPWRGRHSTPAPASRPTCSTRCGRSTTASPGRCWRSSRTRARSSS